MTDSMEESNIRRDAIHEEGTYSTVAISRVCCMHFRNLTVDYFNAKYHGLRNTNQRHLPILLYHKRDQIKLCSLLPTVQVYST